MLTIFVQEKYANIKNNVIKCETLLQLTYNTMQYCTFFRKGGIVITDTEATIFFNKHNIHNFEL